MNYDDMTKMLPGTMLKHCDGGIYKFRTLVRYADRPNTIGVHYDHVWPFEQIGWVRTVTDFKNFEVIDPEEAFHYMQGMSKVAAQVKINERKEARKSQAK